MKFILLLVIPFSFSVIASASCFEFSNKYICEPTEDNGMQAEHKEFTVQNGVLTMKINPYEVNPRVYQLDGKTYSQTTPKGDVIENTASCKDNQFFVKEVVKTMGYERDFVVTYLNVRRVHFTDTTSSQHTQAFGYDWECYIEN